MDYTQCGGSACNFSAPKDLENKPFLDHQYWDHHSSMHF